MANAYLGLGANLGECRKTLARALHRLEAEAGLQVRRVSSLYLTRPVGPQDQPDFWNAVAEVEGECTPRALLEHLLAVERSLGRVRGERWGPRTLDLDLLWHSDGACQDEVLTVPHPRLTERAFVLLPLAELAPALVVQGQTLYQWANAADGDGVRHLGPWAWREEV